MAHLFETGAARRRHKEASVSKASKILKEYRFKGFEQDSACPSN
jgi:hypothetical protein